LAFIDLIQVYTLSCSIGIQWAYNCIISLPGIIGTWEWYKGIFVDTQMKSKTFKVVRWSLDKKQRKRKT
jgi:hypothetical protein